jgi:hypothetical protein
MTSVRIWRTCLLAAFALALSACYPDLDWREVTSTEGGYKVLMPAKPEHAQRKVVIGGVSLEMTMDSARRDGMAFGAAYADIPAGYARRAELLAAARDALVRNIDGRITAERKVTVDGASGQEFYADGASGGQPMRLAARVLVSGGRLYQVACVGRTERVAEADLALFLDSFHLLPG